MRGWKKRLLCTMLAGVTVLSGCSAGGSGASGSSAGESSGEQTTAEAAKDIVVWTGQRADAAYRDELLKSYNEAHPESNVKMEIFTEDYATTLELAFTSKQAPDIFQVVNNAQYYVERDMLLPLDEFITDEFKARFGDLYSIDQVNNVDGKMYTLTERGITYRLLYNKDIFEQVGIKEPPKNMDEVYEYAKQITEWGRDQGIYGFAMQLKTPASVGERVIDQVGFRNGISAYDYQKGTYDYSVMAPVLEPFCRMYEEQIMFPGVEGLDIDPLRTQFAAGKIGMYIYGNWESTIYAENGQFPAQCQWGVVPIPGVGTDNPTGRTDIKNAGKSWGNRLHLPESQGSLGVHFIHVERRLYDRLSRAGIRHGDHSLRGGEGEITGHPRGEGVRYERGAGHDLAGPPGHRGFKAGREKCLRCVRLHYPGSHGNGRGPERFDQALQRRTG